MSRRSQEAMEPLLLEEDLNNLLFTSLEFGSQTELTVVINHKKRDREDEEKEKKKNTSRRPPPLSGAFFFFFFNFSFWQPNNTSCLREAFMVYNLRPINR